MSVYDDCNIVIENAETGEIIKKIIEDGKSKLKIIEMSNSGEFLALCDEKFEIELWNVGSYTKTVSFMGH